MPHAALWQASDWQFALDTLELVARAADGDAPIALLSEIRLREKSMGTTFDSRQSMRIRYVAPAAQEPAPPLALIDRYRDL